VNNASAAFFRASNVLVMDYPYAAAIASGLRVCDEACVVVGQSVDETRDAIYALQHKYGADRLKVKEETWTFDRGWQERWWDTCRSMTRADWHMYHDADEALSEKCAGGVRLHMQNAYCQVLIFPYIHLFGTAHYKVIGKGFYTHNARLGRASAGYRMRNWCSDAHPKWAACQMVVQRPGTTNAMRSPLAPNEVDAHNVRDEHVICVDAPMLHYGWCRTPQALAISQAKHRAWYANGDGLGDGRVPDVAAYDYNLVERLRGKQIAPYDGPHPAGLEGWLDAHRDGWQTLEAELPVYAG
jgi:hypothetical protein